MPSLATKKLLVFGSTGMLGRDLVPVLREMGAELSLPTRLEVDVTDAGDVREIVALQKPDWIVNCAAYTAVDDAEVEYASAFAVNSTAVAHIAEASAESDSRVLHISTDYVFGGGGTERRSTPYSEDERVEPCGIYGHSKYYGEQLLRAIRPNDHLVLRTSWLHGVHGKNFVDTMLRLGGEREELTIVDDQIGSPTWTAWLASVIACLIERDVRGLYHTSSRGDVSWFDFAEEIFRQAQLDIRLGRQTTAELGRPAPRPAYSTLSVEKLENLLGEPCPDWRACVTGHLAARAGSV